MKNITYAAPTRLLPMVGKDLSSTTSEADETIGQDATNDAESEDKLDQELDRIRSVSYTHLTLPTIYSV